ncbi:MAG: carboxypeptidase regulatory-like domain-containing protein, partial [Longimicrobiaceae bacterium]
ASPWRGGGSFRRFRSLILALLVPAALAAAAVRASAQQGDVLAGTVRGPSGAPLAGATVRATDDAGHSVAGRTDAAGRFSLAVARVERWVLSVEARGMVPRSEVVLRAGERTSHDVALELRPVRLAPVRAVASRPGSQPPRPAPGDRTTALRPTTTEHLPVEAGELAQVAALTPGVQATEGDDGAAGISIAGQDPSQTRTTADGATSGAASFPQEALYGTRVVTSTFDVSRGQFTGGQVAVQTRSGGPRWAGAGSLRLQPAELQYGGPIGARPGPPATARLDAGGGGPLVPGKLFAYGALRLGRRTSDAPFLDPGDAAGLRRLQVSPDSALRFEQILAGLGLPGSRAGSARLDNASALARFDLPLSPSHALMLRLDGRGVAAEGIGASALARGGTAALRTRDGGALAQLSSRGSAWENQLRAYATAGERRGAPALELPAGVVLLSSAFDDGSLGAAALTFGGNAFLSTRQGSRLLEVADEAVRTSADERHRLGVGALFQAEGGWQEGSANERGTFTFASLADLAAGRAASFTRTLGGPRASGAALQGALYAGDTWRTGALALTYGVRLEASRYGEREAGPGIEALFGAPAGVVPGEVRLSPRAGFTWTVRKGDAVRGTLRGGVGEFRGRVPIRALAGLLGENGVAAQQLVCVGPAAPAPDWAAYAADPSAVPSTCAGGASTFAARAPSVTLFDAGFRAPRVWRASFGGDWQVGSAWFVESEATLLAGRAQPLAFDRNLVALPPASLAAEAGRPLFAAPAAVDPLSGGIAAAASRRQAAYGSVREMTADGRAWTGQLTLALNGLTAGRTVVGAWYAFTRSRDQTTGVTAPGAGAATTAGDPDHAEWGTSDLEVRHTFQASLSRRVARTLDLSGILRLSSGHPFTPVVEGDVNGDGRFNDRAFVFDPAAAGDTALAGGMRRLLDQAPGGVRDCLVRQLGRIAGRNSCRTPWSPSLDVQATLKPGGPGGSRRWIFTAVAQNVTAGLDYLLHGADGLRGWGQLPFVDRTLLRVRGFDPAAGAFRYDVNPAFGRVAGARGIGRTGFALVLQGRLSLGPDPAFAPLAGLIGGARQTAYSPESVRPALAGRFVNVPAEALSLNGPRELGLTPAQALRLRQAADSLGAGLAPALDSLVSILATEPQRRAPDAAATVQRLG